jgi:hypothetical protein
MRGAVHSHAGEFAAPIETLSQAVSVITLYFKDLCGVDMSPP